MANKTCNKCGQCKPLTEYYQHIRTLDGYRATCKACYNEARTTGTGAPPWAEAENDVIRALYPEGGVEACLEKLDRTPRAIRAQASVLKVRTTARTGRQVVAAVDAEKAEAEEAESEWPIPAQDFASEHLAWQAVRVPAMEPAVNLAPSLGRWAA